MPPNDVTVVHRVEQAIEVKPKGDETILLGEQNARLGEPCEECEEDLATALSDYGFEDVIRHFTPRRWYRGWG